MSQSQRSHVRLGEQIKYLLRALALTKHWTMNRTMTEVAQRTGFVEATIYRWGQGRLRPPDETLETLAWIGKQEAGLDRTWGESLFSAARHSDATRWVDTIWGLKEICLIPNNLPLPAHNTFVGRQAEMTRLLELLSPRHAAHLISIDGIGGVGKTALVLEVAYHCLRVSTGEMPTLGAPTFEAIIFVSAKQQYLTPHGILHRHVAQRTLHDIAREIARTLDRPNITHATLDEQPILVQEALAGQCTLLIVDNLETVEDKQDILAFLYDLPPQVKVIITTRERAIFAPIRLENLPEKDGLQLIVHEAQEKGIRPLDDQQVLALYQCTGGIPAAIIYAVGQMAAGYSLEGLLARLAQHEGDVARFCFEGAVVPLRGQPIHQLLMALAIFSKYPLREAVIHVAGLEKDLIVAEDGLAKLQQISLIDQSQRRYKMLSLTREYALAELAAHPNFEREARERWVNWYLNFTKKYGGKEWNEWHISYDQLDEEWENFIAVFDWCAIHERYEEIRAFWQEEGIAEFAKIYGYWDDRLAWLEWIIQASERRGDWPNVVTAMSNKIWTLTRMGRSEQLREADILLKRAWSLSNHAEPEILCWLAYNSAVLRVRQKQYLEANEWFDRALILLKETVLGERERFRREAHILYYRAEICYRDGNYDQAEKLYREVLQRGLAIDWQRAVIYARNWLADIAITRGSLDEAELMLQTGLPVAERNRDERRTAFFRRSFAYLEQKRRRRCVNWCRQLGKFKIKASAAKSEYKCTDCATHQKR
jgi:hypothetical protein